MKEDIKVLNATRDALLAQMKQYTSGEVTAESCGQIGYLGFATAYTVSVKHEIERAVK